MAKTKTEKQDDDDTKKYDQLLKKQRDYVMPTVRLAQGGNRQWDSNDWRPLKGKEEKYQGLTVFAPVDPYTNQQRKDFRSANSNPYVFRCNRIHTSFVCGYGYTSTVVPRKEEEMPKEQEEVWAASTLLAVPYWDGKEFSAEQIKDWVDKLCKDKLQLSNNLYNGEFVSLEQGRCVLAITPLAKDDNNKWQMPEQIRLIRTEYTIRPYLDQNLGTLKGVQVVGANTNEKNSIIPAERCLYIMHGFNNELYSDYYGDSKVARISDIANTLNVILNEDYPKAAQSRWFSPGLLVVPIPPQEAGNEETIISSIGRKLNDGAGRTAVLTGSSNAEDKDPVFISGDKSADISGLDVMRIGEVKAVITAYGIPGFMLSEGDFGSLGGDANIQEIDTYLNTEVTPDRTSLEKVVEDQLYDRILCILFDTEDPNKLPIKIKHKFNKPKLVTLLPPQLYEQLKDMVAIGLIDEEGFRDFLGLTELDKDTMSEGANARPEGNPWPDQMKSPVQINMWPSQDGQMKTTTSVWGSMPKGWNTEAGPVNNDKSPQRVKDLFSEVHDKIDTWKAGKGIPTRKDLQDPNLRVQWAKILEARKIRKVMEKDGTS